MIAATATRIIEADVTLVVHADVESRSRTNLRLVGAHVYWGDPSTECLMMAYRIGAGRLQLWERGQPQPDDLRQAIADGAVIVAHNAEFEMLAFRWLARNAGWLAPKKYRCTAAMASAMALPRDLETLGSALGLKHKKDPAGDKLIKFFCQPRRNGVWNEPADHPAEWASFKVYCMRDVEAEEEAESRMMPLSDDEQEVYRLGQIINDRGIRIDRRSAYAAIRLAERAKAKFDRQMALVTKGVVRKCTEVEKLHRWINDQGIGIDGVTKTDLYALLDLDVPFHVKQAARLRLNAAKTSVSKVKTMLRRCSADGRVRGGFVYHAASTGRFQSFGVNFANLPRPRKIFEEVSRPDLLFKAIRSSDPDLLELLYGPDLGSPMHLLSDAIRGFIWAAPRKKLIVADYSGIEGVVIAWLANEAWKLQAYGEVLADPENVPDLYRQTAAQIMNMPVELLGKKHPFRQSVGKVSELALGFGGGVGAFASMARNWQIDLSGLFEPVWARADQLLRERAVKRYEGCLSRKESTTLALTRNEWIACELIKIGWRASNSAIAASWRLLEDAIRDAVRHPGTEFTAARVTYKVVWGFLWARLPSGRCLAYAMPRLRSQVRASLRVDGVWAEPAVMDRDLAEKLEAVGKARIESNTWPKVTVLGVNSTTKQWQRFALYGGLAAENNTQATARDILINGMRKAEAAGYPVIGHVYDEIIAEVPKDFGSPKAFANLICQLPAWAAGIPLGAGGFEAKRYRKD